MSIYKAASRTGLTFVTPKGVLNVSQLWSLAMPMLAGLVRDAKKKLTESDQTDELSFLGENFIQKNPEEELRFEILKDIYVTKKSELDIKKIEANKKLSNQKILELIAKKQENDLESKSVEELMAMLQ